MYMFMCLSASVFRVFRSLSLHVLRQFHRLHFVCGQMINVTATNVVPVLQDVATGHSLVPMLMTILTDVNQISCNTGCQQYCVRH